MRGTGLHGGQVQRVPDMPDETRLQCGGRAAGQQAEGVAPFNCRKIARGNPLLRGAQASTRHGLRFQVVVQRFHQAEGVPIARHVAMGDPDRSHARRYRCARRRRCRAHPVPSRAKAASIAPCTEGRSRWRCQPLKRASVHIRFSRHSVAWRGITAQRRQMQLPFSGEYGAQPAAVIGVARVPAQFTF